MPSQERPDASPERRVNPLGEMAGTVKFVIEKTKSDEDKILTRGCLAMLKYMGKNCQIITEKRFIVTYLCFFAGAFLDKPSWQGKLFRVDDKEDLTVLLKEIIQHFNNEYRENGLRLCQTPDEENGRKYVVVVVERPNNPILEMASILSSDECFLLNKIVDKIFESEEGTVSRVWVVEQAGELATPMTAMKAEEFLDNLFAQHWLKLFNGAFALGPRAIAELETNKLHSEESNVCKLCDRRIYCKATTVACPICDVRTHLHCRKLYASLFKVGMIECKNCQHQLTRDEWLAEPPKKRTRLSSDGNDGILSPPARIAEDSD